MRAYIRRDQGWRVFVETPKGFWIGQRDVFPNEPSAENWAKAMGYKIIRENDKDAS